MNGSEEWNEMTDVAKELTSDTIDNMGKIE